MLDLNDSVMNTNETTKNRIVMEDSDTSNSSVCNSRDEDSSVLIFDILKRENCAAGESSEMVTPILLPVAGGWLNLSSVEDSGGGGVAEVSAVQEKQVRKSRRGPRSRSSQYRGVTFYRRTGRWESHIWDCGKQVYLGGFDTAHDAARAYDQAAIKFRGVDADINFNPRDYAEDMKQTKNLNKEEFVQALRRQSTGFSRGGSKLRGLSLRKCGSWEAQSMGKTGLEQKSYKGDTMVDASSEGNELHDLDLSIGGIFNYQLSNSSQKPNIERPKINENNSCSYGVVRQQPQIISPSMWSGFLSNFVADNERSEKERRNYDSFLTS